MTRSGISAAMDGFLAPRSVAVIGASDNAERIGGRPVALMLKAGYSGTILPVNPKRDTIQGLPCFNDIDALPGAPDAALIAVPAPAVPDALAALGEKGCRVATLFSAGFAETGTEGERAQRELVNLANRHGMRLLGPNTLGSCNFGLGYYGTFSSSFDAGFPEPGRIGIASQSGAFGAHLAALARECGLGLSALVTTGNEADITISDAIAWMATSDTTDVICAYMEAVNDGPKLVSALNTARAAGKPVFLLKAGRSTLGAQAAASHTASLAGDAQVADAVFAECGAVLVHDPETMMDFAYAASRSVPPKTRSLGVVTVSGGAGIIISDEAARLGLPMPAMPPDAQAHLKDILSFSSTTNPMDCTAQAVNDLSLLGDFTSTALAHGDYGAVLCFLTYIGGNATMVDAIIETLEPLNREFPDTLLAVCAIGEPETLKRYDDAGLLVFDDPCRAVRAIDAMCRLGATLSSPARNSPGPHADGIALPARTLDEAEAKALLATAGVRFPTEAVAQDTEDAVRKADGIGYPVVMKILSPDIPHKSDIGAVKINVDSPAAVRSAYADILTQTRRHAPQAQVNGVLVAEHVSGGIECFMGIKRDPAFGPIAAFGLGGIFVEIINDVALRSCPFDAAAARDMILSIKGAPILSGARSREPADIDALSAMLSELSLFASAAGDRLVAVDLNPVVALPAGQGAVALDAVIDVTEGADDAD